MIMAAEQIVAYKQITWDAETMQFFDFQS